MGKHSERRRYKSDRISEYSKPSLVEIELQSADLPTDVFSVVCIDLRRLKNTRI